MRGDTCVNCVSVNLLRFDVEIRYCSTAQSGTGVVSRYWRTGVPLNTYFRHTRTGVLE
jgi:hypothetical protein